MKTKLNRVAHIFQSNDSREVVLTMVFVIDKTTATIR